MENMSIGDTFRDTPSFDPDFAMLIDTSETQDLGIVYIEKDMYDVQEQLTEQYANTISTDWRATREAEEDLNDQWPYEGDVALISGRIYLPTDSEDLIENPIPKSWGEPMYDGDFIYYFVEDIRLRSEGVEVIPQYKNDGKTVDKVRVAYVFSALDDDHEDPLYTAYLGELSKHVYDTPTPIEAEARLERHWPEVHHLIETLIKPNGQTMVARRVNMLIDRIKDELSSPELRRLVMLSINHRLAFDQDTPYITTAKDLISAYDGIDPTEPDDPGDWLDVKLKKPLTVLLRQPAIYISKDSSDTILVTMMGYAFNEESDSPEYLSIELDYITEFRGTRSIRSIGTRSLLLSEGNDDPKDTADIDQIVEVIDSSTGPLDHEGIFPKTTEHGGHEPEAISEMRMLEKEIFEVIRIVKEAQKTIYNSIEEANSASIQLVDNEIGSRLIGAGISNGYELYVSGRSIKEPLLNQRFDMATDNTVFVLGINPNEPFVHQEEGDTILGIASEIHNFVSEVQDHEGRAIGYTVNPSLLVSVGTYNESLLSWQGVQVVGVEVGSKAIIPLNGTADIRIVHLERYRKIRDSLQRVRREYGRDPIVNQIYRLNGVLKDETEDYQPMTNPRLFSKITQSIRAIYERGDDVTPVMKTLEHMLVGRMSKIEADIYSRNGDEFTLDESTNNGTLAFGKVIDVRDDLLPGEPVMIFNIQGNVMYVPFDTIKRFYF